MWYWDLSRSWYFRIVQLLFQLRFSEERYFIIRRVNKFCADLPTDQTIEITLMRSIKSIRGITRGYSVIESMKMQWILGGAIASKVCDQIESFCELQTATDE